MVKNRTLGSTLIIAGTTIGAGMLAMPLTSAGMGFGATLALLIGLWLLLSYSGLLFMEVYQTASHHSEGVASLAERYFGLYGRFAATFSLLILLYALLSAYITGGGSLLSGLLPVIADTDTTSKAAILLFTCVLGGFVVWGMHSVDGLNRVLFFAMIIAFAALLMMMLPKISIANLTATPISNALILSAAPFFFTSFGFHVIMASINTYLQADIRRMRIAILSGTAIPLIAYMLWQLVTHGVLSQNTFMTILQHDPTLNGLVNATRQITGSTVLSEAVRIFSALALITSFLGVSLGLFEGVGDLLKRVKLPANRLTLTPLTFIPPLVFALFYPDGFIAALGYAGLLFGFYGMILPIGMAWRVRRLHPDLPYRVIGGSTALFIALLCGIIIMAIPFLIQAGLLPPVAG